MLVAIWIYLLIQTIGYCWVIFKKPVLHIILCVPYYIITILLLLKAYSLV